MTKCLLVLAFGAFMGAGGLAFGLWLSESDNYQLPRAEYEKIDYPVCDWCKHPSVFMKGLGYRMKSGAEVPLSVINQINQQGHHQ